VNQLLGGDGQNGRPFEPVQHFVADQQATVAKAEHVLVPVFATLADEDDAAAPFVVAELNDGVLEPETTALQLDAFGQRVESLRAQGKERGRPAR
jgi:hypothetical protein